MVDEHELRRIARSLLCTGENEESVSFSVNGVGFSWPYPERVHPKRVRAPRLDSFVVRVAGGDDKQAILAGGPGRFFATDHYDRYPAVLVRLAEIDSEQLTELLTDAHAAATKARSITKKRRARQLPYARLMDGH
ncbi:MAG: hypothetical protein M3121_00855 [Chloroflexota bacterium]|nr:hypothetical protein [Chloroflexota bacterium]